MHSFYRTTLLGLLMVAPLAGQRPPRGLISLDACDRGTYQARKVGEAVEWSFSVSKTGAITATGPGYTTPDAATLADLAGDPMFAGVTLNSRTPDTRTAQSLIDVPGGHCAIGPDLHLLIAGRTLLGDGRVEHWAVDATSGDLTLQADRNYPGFDWGGVGFDAASSTIYLLDSISGDILSGAWDLSTGAFPASLQLFAPFGSYSSAIPPTLGPGDLGLRYVDGGMGQAPVGGAVFVYEWLEFFDRGTFLEVQAGTIQTTSGRFWNVLTRTGPTILPATASEGGTTVDVRGSVGKTVVLSDLQNGMAVGSAVIPTGGVVTINASSPFVIGHVYEAQYSGESAYFPSSFECVARYGVPETTTFGLSFLGRVGEPDAVIGQSKFTIVSNIEMNPAPTTAGPILGIWSTGNFRDASGVDPIITDPLDGQGEVLYPIAIVDAGGFAYTDGTGYLQVTIPLANDPALVGLVLLTQFSILDLASPSWLKFSEVIGFKIRDN